MGNETEKRKAPLQATLYGFPVYYRIEMRAGKETLVLSYRSEDTGKIEYEASPVRVREWNAMTEGCFSAEPKNALMLEALLDKTQAVSRFCVGFVGIGSAAETVKSEDREEMLQKLLNLRHEHRKSQFLPLGILLLADWKEYLKFGRTEIPPKETTKQDRIRALKRLQRHEAYTPWPKVTPEKCSSWLALLSEHEAKSTVRLIQYLFTTQKMLDPNIDDPWAEYLPVDGRKPPSQGALVAQHNERISLTDGQCAEIFKRCEEHCLGGKVNSTEFAVLLLMTVPISLEELCALTYQDFCYLGDYRSRLVLKISNEYVKRGSEQNFHLRTIENKYRKRTIPMARLIAAYYEALLKKADISPRSRDPAVLESMYVFSAVNKGRRATPLHLDNQTSRYMAPWIPKSIAKSNESKKRKPITTLRLLQNTALYHMSSIGYEAEEIRRMQGMAPTLVSAKSYQDFVNEAELNKLGALTDCWIQRVYHFPPNAYQTFFGEKKIKLLLPETVSGQSEAMIKISIPPMEQDRKPYSDSTIRVHFSCLCDIFLYAKKHGHANNVLAVFASPKKMDSLTMRIYELINPQNPQTSTLQSLEELHEQVSNRPRSLTVWQKEKLIQKLRADIPRDGRSLGVAIFCYAGLRPAECRKLLWRDLISFVDHPDRSFLNIFEIRGADGNIKEKTKTKSGHRKVPVHCELQKLLAMRLELVRTERPDDYLDLPICCMGNSFWQPCKDYQLASYSDDLFSYIKVSAKDLACYSLDANIERLKNKRDAIYEGEALCLYVLRKNFWTWAEAETQMTDHEKRYVMGHEISDESGRDVRPRLNDENLLWEICQKMDCCVFCMDLHRSLLERELHEKEIISFSNCGTVTFNISPEVLKAGGAIIIHCKAEEVNDPIIYEIPKAVTPLKKMTAEVSSFPVFPHNRTGINCQYENVLAHEKPALPLPEEEDDDYSQPNQ